MISKEERAELWDFIHQVSKGDPNLPQWEYDGSNPFEHPEIVAYTLVDGAQSIGNLPSKWNAEFACAVVNAARKLLGSLDSAEAEIAALKTHVAKLEAAAKWRPDWIPGQYSARGVWIVCRQSEPNNVDGLMGPWLVEWKTGKGEWRQTPADETICGLIDRRMREWKANSVEAEIDVPKARVAELEPRSENSGTAK